MHRWPPAGGDQAPHGVSGKKRFWLLHLKDTTGQRAKRTPAGGSSEVAGETPVLPVGYVLKSPRASRQVRGWGTMGSVRCGGRCPGLQRTWGQAPSGEQSPGELTQF